VLKMHGSVERPDTMVLTRDDFLRFQESETALAGVVQALLLTRHMLFVGFSFNDDNFRRIAHAARRAIGDRDVFGTTLVVHPNPLARELWRDALEWIGFDAPLAAATGSATGDDLPRAAQARLLDVFLDRLACLATTSTTHLGDPAYDGALSAAERSLRDRLAALRDAATPAERSTAAWREVEKLLDRLGLGS
jgi:hypothetical protein